MSQIIIHSKFGVHECKPMIIADYEHDSVPENEITLTEVNTEDADNQIEGGEASTQDQDSKA